MGGATAVLVLPVVAPVPDSGALTTAAQLTNSVLSGLAPARVCGQLATFGSCDDMNSKMLTGCAWRRYCLVRSVMPAARPLITGYL